MKLTLPIAAILGGKLEIYQKFYTHFELWPHNDGTLEITGKNPAEYSNLAIAAALSNPQAIKHLIKDLEIIVDPSLSYQFLNLCKLSIESYQIAKASDIEAACVTFRADPKIILLLLSMLEPQSIEHLSMCFAVYTKNLEVIKSMQKIDGRINQILRNNCKIDDKVILPKLMTPLLTICMFGNDSNLDIVDYLLENRANPNAGFQGNRDYNMGEDITASLEKLAKTLSDPSDAFIPTGPLPTSAVPKRVMHKGFCWSLNNPLVSTSRAVVSSIDTAVATPESCSRCSVT